MTAAPTPKLAVGVVNDFTSTALVPPPGAPVPPPRPDPATEVLRVSVNYLPWSGPTGAALVTLETYRDGHVDAYLEGGRKVARIPIDLLRCAATWQTQNQTPRDLEIANGARDPGHTTDTYVG